MIRRILSVAAVEFRIARRNRWATIAAGMMILFSVVLSAAGSAPSGALGADRLSVVVASLTSLAIYLVPLIALLISFDAIAGEVERGTLPLLLTYPATKTEILSGKLIAHIGIVALAVFLGYATAGSVAFLMDAEAGQGLPSLWRLVWSSTVLGATFLCLGYAASSISLRPSGAAGLAIGIWLVLVVLYDLGLLAAIVSDNGGAFTKDVFPWLLVLNPADAFRLYNLTASEATAAASGLSGAAGSIPAWQPLLSLLMWPLAAFALALAAFRKVQP